MDILLETGNRSASRSDKSAVPLNSRLNEKGTLSSKPSRRRGRVTATYSVHAELEVSSSLRRRLECVVEVLDQVFRVFEPDMQPYEFAIKVIDPMGRVSFQAWIGWNEEALKSTP